VVESAVVECCTMNNNHHRNQEQSSSITITTAATINDTTSPPSEPQGEGELALGKSLLRWRWWCSCGKVVIPLVAAAVVGGDDVDHVGGIE